MSLPQLKTPTFNITIPSTKNKVKARPFIAKEEKILLMAKESGKESEMVNAMETIIKGCSFDVLDPAKLALFDIEYIFLQLRAKSIGETVEIAMICKNKVKGVEDDGMTPRMKPCGATIKFTFDLKAIEVQFDKDHKQNVMMDDTIGIKFKYPNITTVGIFEKLKETDVVSQIVSLVDSIFDGDDVYSAIDTPEAEIVNFIENLTAQQIRKIKTEFFDTMPVLQHKAPYKCPECGIQETHTFKGINDFF